MSSDDATTSAEQESGGESPPVGDDLVVVSNREPYRHHYEDGDIEVEQPAGGLAAGLDPVVQSFGGTWVAWGDGDADFEVTDDEGRVRVPPDDPAYTLSRVDLSPAEVRDYYLGYSNQALWPLCHGLLDKVSFDDRQWGRYARVNERFADEVVDAVDGAATVWFQDYHLALAPRKARERLSNDVLLAQFWHIPWPAPDLFRVCPQAERLLDGLLGNDLLAFHVEDYRDNFLRSVERLLDTATVDVDAGTVTYRGNVTHVEALPMGIDADEFKSLGEQVDREIWRSFKRRYDIDPDTRVAVGVDRLDYTKGIPRRLEALERLWETRPELRGEFTYVQKSTESRSEIPAYQALAHEVETAIDAINERFGTEDWQPVLHLTDHVSREELCALYRFSDAALVSSLRDGMNLVAKEYIATQIENDGALVLSSLAGAAQQLSDAALTVNPYDTPAYATAVERALTMDEEERRQRMQRLRKDVHADDMDRWIEDVLAAAEKAATDSSTATSDRRTERRTPLTIDSPTDLPAEE